MNDSSLQDSIAPSKEELDAAHQADLVRMMRLGSPFILTGMVVELASHIYVFTPEYWPLPILGIAVCGYLAASGGRNIQLPSAAAIIVVAIALAIIYHHIYAGAVVPSGLVLTTVVVGAAGLIMPLWPMLVCTGSAWLLLVHVTFLLDSPIAGIAPMPILTLIVAGLLHMSRRTAIYEGKRAEQLQLALAQREAEQQLIKSQRDFAQTMGMGLAHNLANQLQVLSFAVEDAANNGDKTPAEKDLYDQAGHAAVRAGELITKLQAYSGMGNQGFVEVGADDVVRQLAERVGSSITTKIRTHTTIRADVRSLIEALDELVSNADVAARESQNGRGRTSSEVY